MNNKQWVTLAVVAVVFAAGGFFGGMKYQKSKTPTFASRGQGQFAGGGAGAAFAGRGRAGGAAGGSFVNGEVLSKDNNSITVKNMAGGSQIVILGPSTQYREAVDGTADDVTTGKQVTITGTSNADGSLTAQSVQIRNSTSTPSGMPGQ